MARDFDGAADYLTALISPISGAPCTLSCWVKPDAVSGGSNKYLMAFGDTGSSTNYAAIYISQSTATMNLVHSSSGAAQVSSGPSISAGVWSHAAGVWVSGTSRTPYLNGTAGTTNTFSKIWPPIDNVAVGVLRRSTLGAYTDGAIAEAAIYNVALSAEEISVLAAGLSPLLVRPESLVAYWPLFGRGGSSSDEEDWAYAGALSQVSSPAVADHPRIIYPRRRAAIMVPGAAGSTFNESITESTSTTDTSTTLMTRQGALTESASAADAVTRTIIALAAASESASASDAVQAGAAAYDVTLTEAASAAEQAAAVATLAAAQSEALAAADAITVTGVYGAAVSEAANAQDASNWGGAFYAVELAEAATLQDAVAAALAALAASAEAGNAADSLAVILSAGTAVLETAAAAELVFAAQQAGVDVSEAASAADAVDGSVNVTAYAVDVAEAASAADTVTAAFIQGFLVLTRGPRRPVSGGAARPAALAGFARPRNLPGRGR